MLLPMIVGYLSLLEEESYPILFLHIFININILLLKYKEF